MTLSYCGQAPLSGCSLVIVRDAQILAAGKFTISKKASIPFALLNDKNMRTGGKKEERWRFLGFRRPIFPYRIIEEKKAKVVEQPTPPL